MTIKADKMGGSCGTYGVEGNVYRVLVKKPDGKKNTSINRRGARTILKWLFETKNGTASSGFIWLRTGTGGSLL